MNPRPPEGLPTDCQRLIVVGGSFDPVHRAHIELPDLARRHWHPEDAWLLYVPTARSPFKDKSPRAGEQDRLAMLRLALADTQHTALWTDEIDRAREASGPSYTIETLERLYTAAPWVREVRLLMGVDQAVSFHRWRQPRRILELASPLVILRDADAHQAITQLDATGYWSPPELARWRSWIVATPLRGVSATHIRELLAGGAQQTELASMLDPKVAEYIFQHGLYGS
ncbi:MAG: nicotinate-nicotinamide nucleotide adenylyltransferase [Planctomycetes bacterium]|nr:nicotinate-nicotinamide nucleotide adenylyltransferase [Planctomycetota bacterium]